MLIVCPSCATSYDVQTASLPPDGRQVRCVRCRTVWRAEPTRAEKLLAAAEALASVPDQPREAAFAHHAAPDLAAQLLGEPADEPTLDHHPADDPPAAEGFWQAPDEGSDAAPLVADAAGPAGHGQADAVAVDAPSISPVDLDEGRPPIDVADDHAELPEDIETYADRRLRSRSRRKPLRWPLSRFQTAILVLLILDAIVIGWRGKIVRILPQTASFYGRLGLPVNLRGLFFDEVTTATEQHEGVPILVVEGNIVNETRKAVDVPRLKFAVLNTARQEIYSWTAVPTRATLPPGEALSFHTRLASPPPDSHEVLVRFLNRRDIMAGAR